MIQPFIISIKIHGHRAFEYLYSNSKGIILSSLRIICPQFLNCTYVDLKGMLD